MTLLGASLIGIKLGRKVEAIRFRIRKNKPEAEYLQQWLPRQLSMMEAISLWERLAPYLVVTKARSALF
jgi:hypothetical protein